MHFITIIKQLERSQAVCMIPIRAYNDAELSNHKQLRMFIIAIDTQLNDCFTKNFDVN